MLKIVFENAQVEDNGYGLLVNGRYLSEIISTALGTRVKDNYGCSSGLPAFERNSCDISVIIDPHPVTVEIGHTEGNWYSVEEMEEEMYEQYKEKNSQTEG